MSFTIPIPKLEHEPTGISLETSSGDLESGTEFETACISSQLVTERTTSYDGGRFFSSYVHICPHRVPNPDVLSAEVKLHDDGSRYLVVTVDAHAHLFLPIEIADAIADAVFVDLAVPEEAA